MHPMIESSQMVSAEIWKKKKSLQSIETLRQWGRLEFRDLPSIYHSLMSLLGFDHELKWFLLLDYKSSSCASSSGASSPMSSSLFSSFIKRSSTCGGPYTIVSCPHGSFGVSVNFAFLQVFLPGQQSSRAPQGKHCTSLKLDSGFSFRTIGQLVLSVLHGDPVADNGQI